MDEKQKEVYELIKEVLTGYEFAYEENDEKDIISISLVGNDLSIPVLFGIDTYLNSIKLISNVPFSINKEKITDLIIACNVINETIPCGKFFASLATNSLIYKNDLIFEDSIVSEKAIQTLVNLSLDIIDTYNEKLFGLNCGIIDLQGFLKLMIDE